MGRRLLDALVASTEAADISTIQSGIFPVWGSAARVNTTAMPSRLATRQLARVATSAMRRWITLR